jgi:Family of unknown function (DUF6114)/zinc-ribbon domain
VSAPTFVPTPGPAGPEPARPPERPTGAFISATLGGIAILVFAVLEIDIGASCEVTANCTFTFGGVASVYVASGILGAVVGALSVAFATLLYTRPEHRVVSGVMLIVFAILSLVSFGGGFGIGFIGTLLGGILAIAWQPGPQYLGYQPVYPAPYPYSAPYAPPPVAPVAPAVQRICLKCGRAVDLQAKFCSHCGNPLA